MACRILPMSINRNRQTKRIVNAARKTLKKSPAMPSTALIASGTDAAIEFAPASTFSAAPLSPTASSSSEDRSWSTSSGRSWRKSRTPPTSGTRNNSASRVMPTAAPSTVTVAASPRDRPVLAMTKRRGYSKTSARKIPTKTMRNASAIVAKAHMTAMAAAMSRIVRSGSTTATREGGVVSIRTKPRVGTGRL